MEDDKMKIARRVKEKTERTIIAMKCNGCRTMVDEVCPDGFCRACHRSISWHDCFTRTDIARIFVDSSVHMGVSLKEAKNRAKDIWPFAELDAY